MVCYSIILTLWICCPCTLSQLAGELRLVDRNERSSSSIFSGRLEIFYGKWETVCYSPSFTLREGDVACRELGFPRSRRVGNVHSLGYTVAPLGRGATIGNISCISAAPRLVQCHLSVVSSCQRSNAVGLECAIILTRPPVQHNSTYRNSYTRGRVAGLVGGIGSGVIVLLGVCSLLGRLVIYYLQRNQRQQNQLERRTYPERTALMNAGNHSSNFGDISAQQGTQVCSPQELKDSQLQEVPPPSYENSNAYPTQSEIPPPPYSVTPCTSISSSDQLLSQQHLITQSHSDPILRDTSFQSTV